VRLLIVSHTVHHADSAGRVAGWGPTVREIDELATLFDEVHHVAPLHAGPPPPSALPYAAKNVRLVPVPARGGDRWTDKLGVLLSWPRVLRTIRRELKTADAVHVRAPANIALAALLLLRRRDGRPAARWIKYAGNWSPSGAEPWSYRLQRRLLRRGIPGAVVTVNGEWPGEPAHVRSFRNPSLTDAELTEGRAAFRAKPSPPPLRLLFVGRIEEAKGAGRVLEILRRLREKGIAAELELVGEGPERESLERRAAAGPDAEAIRFRGGLPRPAIAESYARAHVLLLPSTASEGWPKVLSEAMAYGAVPVASAISSVPEYLRKFGCGRSLPALDVDRFVTELERYAADTEVLRRESARAVESAEAFSYTRYLAAVREILPMKEP
jgi:glycosyltransferase involved in cell wall biosynthesis